jgi:uncharacterized protein (TIGR03067 family)
VIPFFVRRRAFNQHKEVPMVLPASALLGLLLSPAVAQIQPPPPLDPKVAQELQRLQGGWQVESQEENGEKLSADDLKGRTLFFGRETCFARRNSQVVQVAALKLDPTKKIKTINAIIIQGDRKGEALLGIFERAGDTLKLCFDLAGEARPKEFTAPTDSSRLLIVCKRMPNKDNQPDLSGAYRSESTELDGSKHVADVTIERMGDAYLVTYKKGEATVFMGVGIRKGDVFCMSWISAGQIGVTLYSIEKNHRLIGDYTRLGGPGILSREVLTRVDYD